ncbi:MAG: response regulator transcription factor [Eubacteriales bacterium]|nr:response regulator transcription factor [Eubacteriales bacterium]
MATILIFEPNEQIAHKLCDFLKREKHNVKLCGDQNDFSTEFPLDEVPLILLDASMKWINCRPLFEQAAAIGCPVLFITNDRRMSTHLRALYNGHSDVLVHPFSLKALNAKVQALIGGNAAPCEISVNEAERVALLDGRRIELTAQELALLLALMEKPDIPVSREQLLRKAWGYQSMGETRTVDVHVQRLRKKLGGEYIETVYKCGYRLKLA